MICRATLSAVEHDASVGDAAQHVAVRDDNDRRPTCQPPDDRRHDLLVHAVEVFGGLVKQHQRHRSVAPDPLRS